MKLFNTLLNVECFFFKVGVGRGELASIVCCESTTCTDTTAGMGICTLGNPTVILATSAAVMMGAVIVVVVVFIFKVVKEDCMPSKSSTSSTRCNLIRTSFFRLQSRSFLMSFGNIGDGGFGRVGCGSG